MQEVARPVKKHPAKYSDEEPVNGTTIETKERDGGILEHEINKYCPD